MIDKDKNRLKYRLLSLQVLFVMFGGVLLWQLYAIQIVRGEEFRERGASQYSSKSILFDRGTISFSEKNGNIVSAATTKAGYTLVINAEKLRNPEEVYTALSSIVPLDQEEFFNKTSKKDDPYEEIAHRLSLEMANGVRELGIPGISLFEERWRYYPGNTQGAHTLGFVGYGSDENIISGKYGIERYYNNILERNTERSKLNFFAEIFSAAKEVTSGTGQIKGDIVLTIEPTSLHFLETKLSDIREKWGAEEVGGIIMDPQDGSILALSALPNFDPNIFNEAKDIGVFRNPLIENVYEFGSVVKPLAMAIGINEGAVTEETVYDDPGTIIVDGSRISNYDGVGRGSDINMQEVLNQSLNTGMVFVMREIGRERFSDGMLSYGLGEETGVDLPGDISGIVQNLESPRDVEHATAAFGQGIAITPVAMTRALASLANGGRLITPHLLKEVRYGDGLSKGFVPVGEKRILKKETSEKITEMLTDVVDTALLNGKVKMDNYSIAAKTGTAQIPKTNGKGYYDDRYLHAFFGYFPASDPKFLVFLYAVHPKEVRYASQTLTEPFMDIAKFLLAYYAIPPDR